MKNLLITGAAGFIGSNFVRYIQKKHKDLFIVSLDYLSYAGSQRNLEDIPDPTRHTFIMGNVCDQPLVEWLLRTYKIDTIVHFAAETHVDRSIVDPEPFILSNITCTFHLLEAARKVWTASGYTGKRFHHISTDEVYGSLERSDPPSTEITPCRPTSPYAASKAAADQLCISYCLTYGLPLTISRCSNNYGAYQLPEKLIPKIIYAALHDKLITVHGDGRQIRDWIHVHDHCCAVDAIIEHGRCGEIYNVGGTTQRQNLEVITTICRWLENSLKKPILNRIAHETDRIGNDRRYNLDITKIYRDLGWQPNISFDEGLMHTLDWYLTHQEWLEESQKQLESHPVSNLAAPWR